MSDSVTVVLDGRVLTATVRKGVSKRNDKSYEIPEVELLTAEFDKLVITWGDDDKLPAPGDGLRVRCRLSGSAWGLRAQCLGFDKVRLDGALGMVRPEVEAPAAPAPPAKAS